MSNVLMLEDPVSLRAVAADMNPGAGGGFRVSVSPYNFLYTILKENPKNFVGMVFRSKDPDHEERYVRIVNAVHKWIPSPKRGELPFLEYLAVRWENMGTDLLKAVEMIEEHRQKTEGEFKDENKGN